MSKTKAENGKRKADERQQELPYDPNLRWSALKTAIDHRPLVEIQNAAGVWRTYVLDAEGNPRNPAYKANFHRVMEAINYSGGNNPKGCRFTVATLAEKCFLSPTVVRRFIREAESLGWLIVQRDRFLKSGGGQISNHYSFDWIRIIRDARNSQEQQRSLFDSRPASQVDNPPCQVGRPGCQPDNPASQVGSANKEVVPKNFPKNHSKEPPPPKADGSQPIADSSLSGSREDPLEVETANHAARESGGGGGFEFVKTEKRKPPTDDGPLTTDHQLLKRLLGLGVVGAAAALSKARKLGATPTTVELLIAHYEANAGAWGPGALMRRIENAAPGIAPGEIWPTPADGWVSPEAKAKQAATEQRESLRKAAEARERDAARKRSEARERELGPILDDLTDQQVEELAGDLTPFELTMWRRSPPEERRRGFHRTSLLDLIEEQASRGGAENMNRLFEDGISMGAEFSKCRTWRYVLYRKWDHSKKSVAFIGLNPSSADETEDDPTIRRCMNFARDWGYGGLVMLNLFGYRSTDPVVMKLASDPVGPDNEIWLKTMSNLCGVVVAAWGVHGVHQAQDQKVIELLSGAGIDLHCLGTTKAGHPKHPLYLKKDLKPLLFAEAQRT